jgi:hypothetical protein
LNSAQILLNKSSADTSTLSLSLTKIEPSGFFEEGQQGNLEKNDDKQHKSKQRNISGWFEVERLVKSCKII